MIAPGERIVLDVPRYKQPDDVTCGPTSLAQVYHFYGVDKPLKTLLRETPRNPDGGTLAVNLGIAALRDGFGVISYSYNLRIFDPTWRELRASAMLDKLRRRLARVKSRRLARSIAASIRFLELGGRFRFAPLERELLIEHLAAGQPILTGLSATWLYQTPREMNEEEDDVHGDPVGHFVVICGYYPRSDKFLICDPEREIPFSRSGRYAVRADRLIPAILLGDVTYDANLLILRRPGHAKGH